MSDLNSDTRSSPLSRNYFSLVNCEGTGLFQQGTDRVLRTDSVLPTRPFASAEEISDTVLVDPRAFKVVYHERAERRAVTLAEPDLIVTDCPRSYYEQIGDKSLDTRVENISGLPNDNAPELTDEQEDLVASGLVGRGYSRIVKYVAVGLTSIALIGAAVYGMKDAIGSYPNNPGINMPLPKAEKPARAIYESNVGAVDTKYLMGDRGKKKPAKRKPSLKAEIYLEKEVPMTDGMWTF